MTNPTTPFSWQMPTSSDLVTDLPADFEVFGQAVATSMADLLGGTTGQILAKASNNDMDFNWITNDVGDITAVSAGTGLSGGGTSGAVTLSIDTATTVDLTTAQTLTNKTLTSPVLTTPTISTIDAKGDLLAGTADNTIGRLAVGTNNQVLTADSSTATGMKWATPAAGGGGKVLQVVSATTTTATTIATTTLTDTTITATITPTLSTSKILVLVSWNCDFDRNAIEHYIGARIQRGATTILDYGTYKLAAIYTGGGRSRNVQSGSMSYLDSPATTSATTYKVQGAVDSTANSGTSTWQYGGAPSTITLLEIGA
jgi:hypothetical protein